MSKEKMSEQISSLVDGEEKLRQADIESIKNDSEIAKKWKNYHLISDIMRDTAPVAIPKDFTASVMHAIAQEPVVLAPKTKQITSKTWFRPVAGLAVAATVALATIGGMQTLWQPQLGASQDIVASNTAPLNVQPVNNAQNRLLTSPNIRAVPVSTNAARVSGVPVSQASFNQANASDLRWKRLSPADIQNSNEAENKKMSQELNKLLINHIRSAGTLQGMMPYARIAGYDEK